jgi:hypothetical protein
LDVQDVSAVTQVAPVGVPREKEAGPQQHEVDAWPALLIEDVQRMPAGPQVGSPDVLERKRVALSRG